MQPYCRAYCQRRLGTWIILDMICYQLGCLHPGCYINMWHTLQHLPFSRPGLAEGRRFRSAKVEDPRLRWRWHARDAMLNVWFFSFPWDWGKGRKSILGLEEREIWEGPSCLIQRLAVAMTCCRSGWMLIRLSHQRLRHEKRFQRQTVTAAVWCGISLPWNSLDWKPLPSAEVLEAICDHGILSDRWGSKIQTARMLWWCPK